MRKLFIILILLLSIVGCAGNSPIILGITVISNDRLFFITSNGDLIIREPNWDPIVGKEIEITYNVVDGVSDVYALSIPCQYSKMVFVILNDKTLWQLAENSDANKYHFEKVPGVENCVKVCSGLKHVIALLPDGSVFSWGDNTYGQLGDGTNDNREAPREIPGLSNIVDIAAGESHCIALSDSGKVYTWGQNLEGQLGDGSYTQYSDDGELENHDRNTVYQVEDLADIVQIAAGNVWSMALRPTCREREAQRVKQRVR